MKDIFKIALYGTKKGIKHYLTTNVLFLTFIITSLFNSTILRFFTVKNYFDIKPIVADLAILLIIGAIGYLIKPKHQFKYFFTWGVILTLICFINSVYYNNFLSYTSFSLIATSFQALGVTDAIVENIIEGKDFIFFLGPIIMLGMNKYLKTKDYYKIVSKIEKGKVRALNTLIVGLVIGGLFIITLSSLEVGRFSKQWNREYVVSRFGLYTYQFNDLFLSLKPRISPLFGYDRNLKKFREFYEEKWQEPVKTNEYTNIFKGKNIITIHAESIQTFTIGMEFNGIPLTPNLNKLSSEGLYFSNFYSQESVGTSSDSEFTLNTSLMPASSGTVSVNYYDREYVSIPKLLKEQGYYSFSMHGNNGTFWNRNVLHEHLGYDKFYYHKKDFNIDETIGLGLSDKSFFNQAVPLIKEISDNHNNFYGTMIMLTNHTPFLDVLDYVEYDVDIKYEVYNEETNTHEVVSAPYMEGTKLGNYLKSVHYADEAIGQFINDLDISGLLDNTVIVIYGDHDAKVKRSEYNRLYNYDPYTDSVRTPEDPDYIEIDEYKYELNRKVPFIIWTKENSIKKEVTKVMGMYDVMPTLGNMFGFNNKYALGNDIFSIDENIVVFPNGNWLTNKMYYHAGKEEGLSLIPDEIISIDYIEKNTKKAETDISISNSIIVYDLIKKTLMPSNEIEVEVVE